MFIGKWRKKSDLLKGKTILRCVNDRRQENRIIYQKDNTMEKNYTKSEIINLLKWFHGEEFDKYPLLDNFLEENNKTYI